ncbi:MAG: hypothetical protein RI907_2994 [Pseudomonadota bacterium]|jgi:esterase FrsA
MSTTRDTLRRCFITACMLTRTTELAARGLGAGYFLPALFNLRYASMGGLDARRFAAQMQAVRSFKDEAWCQHWDALAEAHLQTAGANLPSLAALLAAQPPGGEGADHPVHPATAQAWATVRDDLGDALAPLGPRVADWLTLTDAELDAALAMRPGTHGDSIHALQAVRGMIKAITYLQVSAFPGHTPGRMAAYRRSRALFHELSLVMGPLLGLQIERHRVDTGGDPVDGYLVTPASGGPHPLAIITNGLEGTVQELAIPLLRYHDSGMAVFIMEMPGTYACTQPLTPASESTYHAVISQLARHPCVDPQRIGLVGISFGAHWAVRMAAVSPQLRCAVACGAPTHHSFKLGNAIGIPDIIVQALRRTTGARTLAGLGHRLMALSLRQHYARIGIPLLVINGDRDTLLSTQDSVEVAAAVPRAVLKLYPNDDHCAMGHYREWLDLSQAWLLTQLKPQASARPQPQRQRA